MDDNKIAVKIGDSVVIYNVLFTLDDEVSKKHYIFYSDNSVDEENLYVEPVSKDDISENELIVYTDGSYDKELKLSSYGVVCIQKDRDNYYFSGVVEDVNGSRNVIGEINGVLAALKYAEKTNKNKVYIYHDYEGLAKWVNGDWNTNSIDAINYCERINQYSNSIQIEFYKVDAHSGIESNEFCDKLAKNELKSLKPSVTSEKGFQSYRYKDETIKKVLDEIKNNVENFQYKISDNNNHIVYRCFLGKDKLSFKKYKITSTNNLFIPIGSDGKIYSLILSYLNESNSVDSMIKSMNVNNNINISEKEVKKELYDIAPNLSNKNLNSSLYSLLLQSVYNLNIELEDFVDCSFLVTPALRALEGQLKIAFKEKLNIDINNGSFHYYDVDSNGIYTLQNAHACNLSTDVVDYFNKCYNEYHIVRNRLLHFGDIDIDDTATLTLGESKEKIVDLIELISQYY